MVTSITAPSRHRVSHMAYEPGMQIVFDLVSKTTVISFRDEMKMLGPYENQRIAIAAGEEYCRDRGWIDEDLLPEKRE
jgi:hypothetical protein